jgi:hypothetical protein
MKLYIYIRKIRLIINKLFIIGILALMHLLNRLNIIINEINLKKLVNKFIIIIKNINHKLYIIFI